MQFSILPSKGKEEKKEEVISTQGIFVFGHPSRYELLRTGLNSVERTRRGAVLVV